MARMTDSGAPSSRSERLTSILPFAQADGRIQRGEAPETNLNRRHRRAWDAMPGTLPERWGRSREAPMPRVAETGF